MAIKTKHMAHKDFKMIFLEKDIDTLSILGDNYINGFNPPKT